MFSFSTHSMWLDLVAKAGRWFSFYFLTEKDTVGLITPISRDFHVCKNAPLLKQLLGNGRKKSWPLLVLLMLNDPLFHGHCRDFLAQCQRAKQ